MSRTYTNITLLLSIFALGEFWHFADMDKVNLWLKPDFQMPIEKWWYYKFLSGHISWILASIVLVRLSYMRQWLEMVAIMHLLYQIYNLWAFLYDFNQERSYVVAYSFSGIVTALVFYLKHIYKKKKRARLKKNKEDKLVLSII